MSTIKDVARLAGVSYTTVSHVLNQTRPVSADARERVLRAVDELAYVPSALARSLRSKVTGSIGLIIPNNTNPYFSELARGIEDYCYEAGYSVILCNSDDDPDKQRDYLQVLQTKRCDGLIIATLTQTDLKPMSRLDIPTVLLDRAPKELDTDLVSTDNVLGGQLAARHLLDMQRRRVACIAGPAGLALSDERVQGLRGSLQEGGRQLDEADLLHADFSSTGGYHAAMQLLRRTGKEQRPDAIFCCNDMMAIGVLRAAGELQIEVPGALSVVGFDDIELAQFVHPPLTTVAQNTRRLGNLTAQFLLERIADPSLPARRETVTPQLQLRGSTAPLKKQGTT
ncbi:LacI family DNA-binding transcriptional regulator [Herbaspirillum sp. LeCh32-8]|uniref:LacI family DNA-binding transcriptional regulator n=1 Tax=Herbaspirillum sp. LeCh32-8 TaxID=2821356 RepID=UPI001AE7AFC4|nr:LacI family DNA-binding transcriptional regulator [Herbaspirillum sp. LeCh32-8]MBP0597546.1 LacI family DNA-binding transcriptional regulator [Herbaspirillum sp. LeCh32-8]